MSERYSVAAGVRDGLVLGYHGVTDRSASRQIVTRSDLRLQVAELLRRGYAGTTFSRAVLHSAAQRRLAVTFDDGEHSVIEHGFPVLSALGVPGTVFVVASLVGSPGSLSWHDLETLAEAGWEVGSHSVTHPRLTELGDAALDEELSRSRAVIEEMLGRPCRSIAYPYGVTDKRVEAAAARAGFTAGCTTDGTLRTNVLSWPRVGVDGLDGRLLLRLKTSRLGRGLRGTPLGAPLERTGRVVRAVSTRGLATDVRRLFGDEAVADDYPGAEVGRAHDLRLEPCCVETLGEPDLLVDGHLEDRSTTGPQHAV